MKCIFRKKVKHICIDGSVDPKKRQGLVDNFQLQPNVKAAILSIQAAGVGLTLTVRHYAPPLILYAHTQSTPCHIIALCNTHLVSFWAECNGKS